MTQLKLYFLGPPRLERDGRIVEPDTRKATALLAYLALVGERPSRDALAAFLWPEFDDRRAKAALRRTLSALKSTVGHQAVYATREQIGLEMDAVWCDLVTFRQLVAQEKWEMAVPLYRDDFLSGFTLRDSIPFDDWQLQQAEQLRHEFSTALEQLVQSAIAQHDFAAGLDFARRWLQLDSLREDAHRQLMRLYAWSGQRSAALLQYRDCVRILDEELGVPPLLETTTLYHDIQNNRSEQPLAAPLPTVALPLNSPAPLIGREVELAQIQQLYREVGPNGRLLIIEGEPGIGKTRLAETLVAETGASGAVVLAARCYDGETNLAYAPIIQMLQDGLAVGDADWDKTLPIHHIAEAVRLLPELASGHSLPPLPNLDLPGAQVRFYEGIAQVLAAMLAGPVPGILWLDDAHWLDAASQELLLYLLHRLGKRPFLILLCWRAGELSPAHPLPPLVTTLRHTGICHTITPQRFTIEQVQDLLTTSSIPVPTHLSEQLFAETEGLPFFVVEYLNALEEDNEALAEGTALAIPPNVRDLLHNRLIRISETERQILQTAAAIGHNFDMDLVQAGSGRSADEVVAALEMLTTRGLLLERAAPTGATKLSISVQAVYDFSHDKLRALVYEEMGLARRRLLHRRLADTLVQQRKDSATAVSAQIANHYQLSGQEEEAATYFVQAGDQARALFAHRDAIHCYRSALALGAADAWHLHAACGELQMRLGAYPDALSDYETAAALAPDSALGHLEQQIAQVYQRQGSWSLAAHTLARAQQHLGETADPTTLFHLTIDRSLVAHRLKQPVEALALAQQSLVQAEAANDGPMLALAYNSLGMLARSQGELETAVTFLGQSRQLADANDRLDIQIAARNNLALAFSDIGQSAEARSNLEEALVLCERFGDRHYEAALHSNLADVLHQAGDETAAQHQIRRSVTIYAEIGREQENWRAEIWQLIEW